MKAQTTVWNCGPASVQNALRWYGKRVGQHRLAEWSHTHEHMEDNHEGLQVAICKAGFQFMRINTDDPVVAWDNLMAPAVVCIDRWLHWVCVICKDGDRILYFDPAKEEYLMKEHYIVSLSRGKFMKRWKASHRTAEGDPAFFGLVVFP